MPPGGGAVVLGLGLERQDDGGWTALLDVPSATLTGLPLTNVEVAPDRISFTLEKPGAPESTWEHFVLNVDEPGQKAAGQIRTSGVAFEVVFERVGLDEEITVAEVERPQTPKPPFPYAQRELTYTNATDGVKLAGTLTIPAGPGPHPAVLLITGSGAQDRDETIFDHKPFLLIADTLTRQGIAVLRQDDRGVGGSTGSTAGSTLEDKTGDALAALAHLQQQPDVDPKRGGMFGHSEGSEIGAIAASRSKDGAFIVLLGGPGISGLEVLILKKRRGLEAAGVPPEAINPSEKAQRKLLNLIESDAEDSVVMAALEEMMDVDFGMAPEAQRAQITPEMRQAALSQQAAFILTPFFRDAVKHDPRPTFEKVTCPVLGLWGELDLQVPPPENIPPLRAALDKAGNKDVTLTVYPKINHLGQTATTGLVSEYAVITETIAPVVLADMTSWIRERAGLGSPTE